MRFRLGLIVLVAFLLAVTAACTSGGGADRSSTASTSASAVAGHDAAGHQAPPARVTKASTPQQLRAQVEQLLGEHTLLAVRTMRAAVASMADFRRAADTSSRDNAEALGQVVSSAYGGAHGEHFQQVWQRQLSDLSGYADAVAAHDDTAVRAARSALIADSDAYGSWLAAASGGRVRAGDAAGAMRTHVEDLMKQLDAYAADDFEQAYRIERDAYQHMFTVGGALARASIAPNQVASFDAPTNKLRSAFAMLLGEHMELIIEAQRATFAGSPEFKAAATQVNANTTALAQAMGTIVGPQKAAEFQRDWADHVEGLMAYTAAVAGSDDGGKTAAEKQLNSFAVTLAAYFAGVVRNQLDLVPLTGAITTHDRHLIDQVQAYAAKDYTRAQQMELEGYQQMLGVANTLVDAIQRSMTPKMPVGGPRTGGGGTAHRSR